MVKKSDDPKTQAFEAVMGKIRKSFGDGVILTSEDLQPKPAEALSTGLVGLDYALGIGGVARGRVVEFFGKEGGGKSLLAFYAMAETQRHGGRVALIDLENVFDPQWCALTTGADVTDENSWVLLQPKDGESALQICHDLVLSNALDMIVVDSVAGLVTKAEAKGNIGDVQIGSQARLMSQGLRMMARDINQSKTCVIFINQLRTKIGIGGYGQLLETTTGGKALRFWASQRVSVTQGKVIKQGDKVIGQEMRVKVIKNKTSVPYRTAEFTLLYCKGLDKDLDLIETGLQVDVLERAGSWLQFGDEKCQGANGLAKKLNEDPELRRTLKSQIYTEIKKRAVVVLPEKGGKNQEKPKKK